MENGSQAVSASHLILSLELPFLKYLIVFSPFDSWSLTLSKNAKLKTGLPKEHFESVKNVMSRSWKRKLRALNMHTL
jgi:hypothetical protein